MGIFDHIWLGLVSVISWPAFGFLLIGTAIGITFGAIPGINAITAIVLILPFLYGMDPVAAITLLVAIMASVQTGNSFPAILFNVPGTPSAAATLMDGYPMAKQGAAARALSASFTASTLGGIIGAMVLLVSIPVIQPIVLMFASPERFMLIIIGIVMIGVLSSGEHRIRGLLAGALGLLISSMGMDPQLGVPRYTFGQLDLMYGVRLAPLVMGLFCLPELIDMVRRGSIAGRKVEKVEVGRGFMQGIRDVFIHWGLVLRGSFLGALVGAIPGLGGTQAAFYAYGFAVQGAKDKGSFGKGDIRGIIAPEASNNASVGGELIPIVAFAIPGNAATALLMAALLVLGIQPGPEMLAGKLTITASMIWTILVSNVLATIVCLALVKPISRISTISAGVLTPVILLFVIFGSYVDELNISNLAVTLGFGLLGFLMVKLEFPRAPLLIGAVLGKLAEKYLGLSLMNFGPWFLFERPISLVLFLIMVTFIAFSFIRFRGATAK